MKYRILGVFLAGLMVLSVYGLTRIHAPETPSRYHQHLEEPGYTPCSGHGDEIFCSHLPLVFVDTEGQRVPGEIMEDYDRFGQNTYTLAEDGTDYINVSVSVIDNAEGNNHPADAPAFTTRSLFRIRGNNSRQFEKLPYLMKFVDEGGLDRDISVMGMDAHSEWALQGPYLDKSLVRNYLCYNLSGELMDYAPNVRYCELFLNGEYRGLYLMLETITNGESRRLNLSGTYRGEEITGYLLRFDRPTETDLETPRDIYSFLERTLSMREDAAIRYPGKNRLTPELAKEIELDFAQLEKCLYSFDFNSDDYGYRQWIDVDSFINYFLINEFTRNVDAGRYSTYYYKEVGGKLKACVWDFNNACDNFISDEFGPGGLTTDSKPLFFMLTKDGDFVEEIIRRYREVRETFLSDEYLSRYIDDTLQWLGPAVERNNARWASVFTDYAPLEPEERNSRSHEEAVEQLRDWLFARGAWLDENIDALRAVASPSRNRQYQQ